MLLRPFAGLGLRSVAHVLGLSGLREEDTMHDRGRSEGCRIRLLCYGVVHRVVRTGGAKAGRVVTEVDGAAALDGSIAVVGEGIAVHVSRSAGTGAGLRIAVHVGESVAVVGGRWGSGAVGGEVGSVDRMAAGAGRV